MDHAHIIDLYWPDRVRRNAEGKVEKFRTCSELGGSKAIESLEQNPPEDVRTLMSKQLKGTEVLAAITVLYVDGKPFAETESIIRKELLTFASGKEDVPLLE